MIDLFRQARGVPTGRIKVVPAAVPPRTRSCLIPSFFVTFFTMLLLLAAFYFVLSSTGMLTPPKQEVAGLASNPTPIPPTSTTWPTPTEPPPGATVSPLPPAPTNPPPSPGPDSTAGPPAASATVATTATASAPVVVRAIVLNDSSSLGSWFTVDVDGATAYNALLRPGRQMQWSGQREVFLNIGDTSIVQLIVNGQPFPGLPGSVRGVPRKLTCTTQGCG
jgi:hypothetical protein